VRVDRPKSRRDGIFALSLGAINGRKRSRNGAKTAFAAVAAEGSPAQPLLSTWRKVTDESLDMSELLIRKSNGPESLRPRGWRTYYGQWPQEFSCRFKPRIAVHCPSSSRRAGPYPQPFGYATAALP
jgi:hypothetical protein